jgi:hypothetical protein
MIPKRIERHLLIITGLFATAAVALVAFQPSLNSGFFLDDWRFTRIAGELSVTENLIRYFDPRQQFQWYRPLQGMQYMLGWKLFGGNAAPAHLARTLFHLANGWLICALVHALTRQWRVGLLAALAFAVIHGDGSAVIWLGDASPYQVMFYLLSLWLWWKFLEQDDNRARWLAFCAFILALLSKEASTSLPLLLFLMERWFTPRAFRWREALRLYAPFVIALFVYTLIEIYVRLYGTPDTLFQGYTFGWHMVTTSVDYLALVVFPWGLPAPLNYLWLASAIAGGVSVIARAQNRALAFLAAGALAAILPLAPFGGVSARYFYMPAITSAILVAVASDRLARVPRVSGAMAGVFALVLVMGSTTIATTAETMTFLTSLSRASFRAVAMRHPTFPRDTLVYFVDPTNDSRDLSGMFFVRYGAGVRASGTDRAEPIGLRTHSNALVVYADAEQFREIQVDAADATRVEPALPLEFENGMRLQGYELARADSARGEPSVLFLYWSATRRVDRDYTVFVHLVSGEEETVEGYDSEPRAGQAHTSAWSVGELIVDWTLFTVPVTAPSGDYRLEIGLYHAPTQQRVAIVDARGNAIGDHVTIAPLRIAER